MNRRRLGWLAAWALFAGGASATGAAAAQVSLPEIAHRLAKNQPIRIVAFGSSTTQGVGASAPRNAYPSVLQRDLTGLLRRSAPVFVFNRGVGGQDADDMLKRMDQDALAARPDLVIWQTGSNDPLRAVPLDRFKDETRAAVLKLKDAGIDVMLLEPQWCAVFDRMPGAIAYRDAVREVGAELDTPVIKRSSLMKAWLREHLLTYAELFAPDGLHMADGGYAMLAHEIALEILQDAGFPAPQPPHGAPPRAGPAPPTKPGPAT